MSRRLVRTVAVVASLTTVLVAPSAPAADTPPAGSAQKGHVTEPSPISPRAPASAAAPSAPASTAAAPQKAGPIAPDTPVPAGHPPMGVTEANEAAIDEDAAHGRGPEVQDRSVRAPDLRPGTIEVHLRDSSEQPLANFPVRLGIMKQDVQEGDTRTQRDSVTDDKGVVTFTGLDAGTAYSYRITAAQGPATFASEPTRLEPTAGQRVLLHVFPVVRDVNQALIGARGIVFVAPREDVFQVEVSFRILNIGKQAWVPENVTLSLPEGAKAFRATDSMKDTRVEKNAEGKIQLLGTYAPGENDVTFQFQLPNEHTLSKRFQVDLLPHVAEIRVIAERPRGMTLEVEGFPQAEGVQGRDGSRLLLTEKQLARGDRPLASVSIGLENLPVPSTGRWYALGLAVAIAAGGLFEASRRRGEPAVRALPEAERKEAERLLLDELVVLEKLRAKDQIGPKTYEKNRDELLNALARLSLQAVENDRA